MTIRRAKRLENIGSYYFVEKLQQIRKYQEEGRDIINLGIGSPDLKPDRSISETLNESLAFPTVHNYQPYKGVPELRKAIKHWYNTFFNVELNEESNILPLLGSKEGVMHIAMTYLNEGDIVMVPNPGYPAYERASELAGATVEYYGIDETNNNMVDGFNPEAKIIWLNFPHMPTGLSLSKVQLKEIIDFAKANNILLVFDNPYGLLNYNKQLSIFQIEGAFEVAIELNSLSKSHNMSGWRIGMLIGNPTFVRDVLSYKSNMDSGMFYPVQKAAIKALNLKADWYEELSNTYSLRRNKMETVVHHLGCTFVKGQKGLFVWALIPSDQKSGEAFSDYVLEKFDVFITPGSVFGTNGDKYVRFSLCVDEKVILKLTKRLAI